MAGKGDRNRSCNNKFKEEYDRLFGKKCTLNHAHDEDCSPKEKLSQSDQATDEQE